MKTESDHYKTNWKRSQKQIYQKNNEKDEVLPGSDTIPIEIH